MARLPRVVLPGIPHHITQRGNGRGQTFFEDDDYALYLDWLAEATQRAQTQVWGYCLMPNHVHVILTPSHEDGLRQTFGLIGVPIRLSMRSGGANPYAPKKRKG